MNENDELNKETESGKSILSIRDIHCIGKKKVISPWKKIFKPKTKRIFPVELPRRKKISGKACHRVESRR